MVGLLVRHLIESTLFCFLVAIIVVCLRRQGAAERHAVWLIGIFKFIIPTFLFTAAGARIAFAVPATAWISSVARELASLFADLFGTWPFHIVVGDTKAVYICFLTIWLLGSAMMFRAWFLRLRTSYDGLGSLRTGNLEALDRAKRRLGFDAGIEISFSDQSREPSLIGIFRPAINIPRGLSERLTVPEFEAVLLHELAHARRRDNLVSAFVHGIVSVFWFHPLLWFIEVRLTAERECACDEAVIHCGIAPQTYLAGLAKVCRFHLSESIAGVSAVSGSNLKARFDQILSCRQNKPVPHLVRILLTGLGILVTVLPIAGGYCEQCGTSRQAMTKREDKPSESRYRSDVQKPQ